MATETVGNHRARIWRLLDSLADEIRVVPIGYRRPFSLIHDCLVELAEAQNNRPS